jgi:drug/metabolite transporter (DMT)-like permease
MPTQVKAGKQAASVLAFTLIYALCYAAIKAGLAFAPPLRFGGLRSISGGLALLALAALLRTPLLPARRNWGALLALALTSTTIAFGAMFLSPGRTGAGIASVLGNMQPLFVLALAAIFLGEPITRRKLVALGFGLGGVALIAYPALVGPGAYGVAGPLLALGASAGTAAGSVIVKWMNMTTQDMLSIAAWQLILGGLPLLAVSAFVEANTPIVWDVRFIGLFLFLALVGTSFATALWYWLVQREDVGRLTMFLFLVPLAGLALATFFLGEPLDPLAALGAGLIVVGIAATVLDGRFSASHHGVAPLSDGRPAVEPD